MTRAFIVWLAVGCTLVAARPARADATHEEPSGAPVMRVYVSGSPSAVARLTVTVRELCARLNMDVVVEEATGEAALEGARAARLKAFVDLRSPSPRIVVVDPKTHREAERRTLPPGASLEMSVEEAAHVLYMAAESVFSVRTSPAKADRAEVPLAPVTTGEAETKAEPSVPPADAERPKKDVSAKPSQPPEPGGANVHEGATPPDRTTTPSHFDLELGGFGGASVFGPSEALFCFGGSIDGGVRRGAFRFSVAASIGAYKGSTVAQYGQTAFLRAETGRLSLVGAWHATHVFAPFLSVGGGGDQITMNANATPGAWAAATESRIDPMFQALLGAKIRFSSIGGAFFAFGTDVDLAPHRYMIETNGARQTFFELARVRPSAFLGLTMTFPERHDLDVTGGLSP